MPWGRSWLGVSKAGSRIGLLPSERQAAVARAIGRKRNEGFWPRRFHRGDDIAENLGARRGRAVLDRGAGRVKAGRVKG
jgi:hypothetical protein